MFNAIDNVSGFALESANNLIEIADGNAMIFVAVGVISLAYHAFLDHQWYRGEGGLFSDTLSLLAFLIVFVSFGFAAYLYVYPYQTT
jgi:hypothetical protein